MTIVFLLLGILAFALILRWLGLGAVVAHSGQRLRSVTGLLQSAEVDDAEKEAAARTAAVALMGTFMAILWRSSLALGAALFCVWLGFAFGLYRLDEAATLAIDPLFLGLAVAVSVIALVIRR
ncbi:hypothetical protein [Algihabitans albus]|uniref:hypothetical protein n=1 Tax=Algihabitans albus TaxID=2164067 RepID=UPI000E5C9C9B|nr:hypothetical protein [Algihabitans albus]